MHRRRATGRCALLAVGALVLVAAGCGSDSHGTPAGSTTRTRTFTPADNGIQAEMEVGERFDIALPANASTGYSWVVVSGVGAVVAQEGDATSSTPSGSAPGTSGTATIPFRAVAVGNTTLKLTYRAPGSTATSTTASDNFSLGISVTKAP